MLTRPALAVLFFGSLTLLAQAPSITEVEVNQALGKQFNGALDFVAGKDTAIRAFLAAPATIDPANTKLVIQRDGNTVTELAPRPYTDAVNIVEFLCPTRAACGNWQAGSYTFSATVNGETRSTAPGTIIFKERQALRILVRPVKAHYKGTIQSVTGDRWRRAVEYVRHVYPVAADKITWVIQDEFDASDAKYDLETPAGERALWEALTNQMPQHCAANNKAEGCFDLIVGFIQSRNLGFPNGTGQGFTMGRPTNIVVASDEDMESTVAHEIAHIYGAGDTYADGAIRCAVNPAPNGMSGKDWDDRDKTTSCSAGRQQFPNVSATLIPAEAQAYEVGGRGALGEKACFMGSGGKSPDYWVTPDVYKRLFDSLDPVNPIKQSLNAPRATPFAQRVIHYSGFLNEAFEVDKDPWYTLITSEVVPDTTGSILIRAVDAAGNTLSSQAITTQFNTLTNPPRHIDWSPFDGVIRFPENTARFEIVANGTVRSTIAVNPTDPIITGVSPTATGTTLNATHTIQWTATPTGPGPLTYLVEYNPGTNPADWMVLADDLTDASWQEDFSTLPGGPQARIRVTATDGVRSASAESVAFRVPYKAPEVYIDDTPATLVAGKDLPLNGEAFDVQDDIIPDSKLLWRSSLSGILGSGAQIVARNLVPGRHEITLSATNSVGLTTVDTVIINVTPAPVTIAIATSCPLPVATAGAVYSQFLAATGGNGLYTFSISSGALPAGINLRNLNGNWVIGGGPTTPGTSNFTLTVTDTSNPVQTASRTCALTVSPAPVVPVLPGAPAALRIAQGDNQSGAPGQQLPLAFVAQLVDANGLFVVGQSASWEIVTPGTINLANVVSTTDPTGRVSALGTLGNVAGTHQLRVRAGSFTQTFQFTVTVAGLRLSRVSGDAQVAYVNRAFPAPLVVELRDGNNNPVPAQLVQWTVLNGAATLSAASSNTDADGRASVAVSAGATPSDITVRATLGTQTLTFSLNSYAQGPLVAAANITTTARNLPGIAPCALTTLAGTAITPGVTGVVSTNPRNVGSLPLSYNGLEVEIGGLRAPIMALANQNGSESIIVQAPCDLPAPGRAQVIIRTPGAQQRVDNVQVFAAAPGIFETTGGARPFAGVTRPDGSYVSESNPARRGETVRVAVTGLGQTNPISVTNREGVANQSVNASVQVRVAGTPARLVSAITAPGLIGVYLVSFEVPAGIAPGAFPELIITAETAGGERVPSNGSTLAAVQ